MATKICGKLGYKSSRLQLKEKKREKKKEKKTTTRMQILPSFPPSPSIPTDQGAGRRLLRKKKKKVNQSGLGAAGQWAVEQLRSHWLAERTQPKLCQIHQGRNNPEFLPPGGDKAPNAARWISALQQPAAFSTRRRGLKGQRPSDRISAAWSPLPGRCCRAKAPLLPVHHLFPSYLIF